jgi:hypothetical protein
MPGAALKSVVRDLVLVPASSDGGARGGAVDVTVRNDTLGSPISGAHVCAFAIVDDQAVLAEMRDTDARGRAVLQGLPKGALWIVADAPGRARGSTRLAIDEEPRAVEINLAPEHTIEVRVKDDLGAPIGGAEIEAVASGDPLPVGARTSLQGTSRVARLGAGPWRVTARAPGYEEGSGRASKDGETVTIVLRKLGSFVVHVVGRGDVPVPGARVSVAGAMLWPARAADTDGQGDVRVGGLAAAAYALRASRGDMVSPIELGVPLGRGEEKRVVLHLASGRWVGVRVTDGDAEDSLGVAAARVTLAEGGLSPFPLEATTDGKGRARLGPISPGPVTLGVRAADFVPRGAILVADPPPPETHVALVRAGALTGRVVDDRGYPIDGATIEIIGTDPVGLPIYDDPRRASFQAAEFDALLGGPAALLPAGELGVMPGPIPAIPNAVRPLPAGPHVPSAVEPWVTRADGTFRAAPASPGRIRAIVRHPQYVEAQSDLVTLAPRGEIQLEIVMHQGGALEGWVVDAHDRPVEGARLLLSAVRGSLEGTTRTASDGSFAFAALPGLVSVTVTVNDDEQPDVRMTIGIPERGRKEVTIRMPERRGALAVTVVDDRDWPIENAQVSASSLSAEVPLRTTAFTDAHGDASIKRGRGLPLRIEASAPGHAPRAVTVDGSGDALRVELAPAESAAGEVVAARGGAAIAGAEVTLYTDLGVRRSLTDARGAFTLAELAPGGGSLRVRAAGFAAVSTPVTITDSGGRRPVALPRLELAAEGVVDGDVVDARGSPVAGARVARDHAPTWLAVGTSPERVATTDAMGRFSLGELPEGAVALEAYVPDLGRARLEGVKVMAGRVTPGARIVLEGGESDPGATSDAGGDKGAERQKRSSTPSANGSVAVTLGETGTPQLVVVVSVAAGSEAERAGVAPGDVLLSVDDAPVRTMADARDKLSGALSDDVVVRVKRGERELAFRVGREPVRR